MLTFSYQVKINIICGSVLPNCKLYGVTWCITFAFQLTDQTVSLDVGKLIQKCRMEKEWSQKELATVISLNIFAIFCVLFSIPDG